MIQNPAMAQALLQQLSGNPGLMQQLGANPEQVLQNILHPGDGDDDEDGPVPPGAHVVSVTPEERAAIERVCLSSVFFFFFSFVPAILLAAS